MKLIREALGVRMVTRDGTIRLMGDRANVLAARDVLRALGEAAQGGSVLNRQQVHDLIGNALSSAEGKEERADDAPDEELLTGPAWTDHLSVYASGRPIRAKPPTSRPISTRSATTTWSSASDPRARARHSWRWPRQSICSRAVAPSG
ncbi:MAG: hypothetical protein QM783_18750 [Phycisphaerales bacterium]